MIAEKQLIKLLQITLKFPLDCTAFSLPLFSLCSYTVTSKRKAGQHSYAKQSEKEKSRWRIAWFQQATAAASMYVPPKLCLPATFSALSTMAYTVPAGSRSTGENGLLYATSVTTDYGTAIPTVTPDDTGIMYASTTKSWRGSWRTDTVDVIQGVYSDSGYSSSLSWHRGCMWFSTAQNLLSGCTVKSATRTLHRKTGSGSSSAKSVYLCAITNTSASGTPSIAYNYGSIGTIGRDKQVTFSIPVDAVQGLADGIYGGLCIYETPYDFGSSNWSNAYMRMSGTDTDYEPYIECVFSGSTAVG
jgi:hypothetical protein